MNADTRPVIEQAFIVPTFCDGLHTIDIDRHGIARVTLFAEQRESYNGTMERVVVARLIMPEAVVAEIAARMLAAHRQPATHHERPTAIN